MCDHCHKCFSYYRTFYYDTAPKIFLLGFILGLCLGGDISYTAVKTSLQETVSRTMDELLAFTKTLLPTLFQPAKPKPLLVKTLRGWFDLRRKAKLDNDHFFVNTLEPIFDDLLDLMSRCYRRSLNLDDDRKKHNEEQIIDLLTRTKERLKTLKDDLNADLSPFLKPLTSAFRDFVKACEQDLRWDDTDEKELLLRRFNNTISQNGTSLIKAYENLYHKLWMIEQENYFKDEFSYEKEIYRRVYRN